MNVRTMVDPIATPADVLLVTGLPDDLLDQAEAKLADATFDIYRHNEPSDFDGNEHRRQAEKKVAALKLAQYVNNARARQQESLGSSQRSYEVKAVEELRREVLDLLPNGEFVRDSKPKAGIDVPEVK